MSKAELIFQELKSQQHKTHQGWAALCPAHEDHQNSLSITEAEDGKVLLKCFAGCSVDQIVPSTVETTEPPKIATLEIKDEGLPYIRHTYARRCNIDGLRLSISGGGQETPRISDHFLSNLGSIGFKHRRTFQGPYDEQQQFSSGRISIWIARRPRFTTLPPITVQINPAHLSDFRALQVFLEKLVVPFIPCNTKVTELDISLDLVMDIRELLSCFMFVDIRRLETRDSNHKTMSIYFGANKQLIVYDKGEELGLRKGQITRLEMHFEKSDVPCRTFANLPRLGKYGPIQGHYSSED